MRFEDLTGQRFGRLTAVRSVKGKDGRTAWVCSCDCGGETTAKPGHLKSGHTKSCGCIFTDVMKGNRHRRTHGGAPAENKTRLYHVWQDMKRRCYNPNSSIYKHYGGRGIAVCEEWKTDFQEFRKWAQENGYNSEAPRGKCTLDRIDVNGNYEPSNCRWVDMKTQSANRRPWQKKTSQ